MTRHRILATAALVLLGTGIALAQQTGRLTLSELEGLIDDPTSENATQQTELDALGTEQSDQQSEIDALDAEQAAQQTEIDALGTEQASQQGEIDSLGTEQAAQRTEIDALDTQTSDQETRIAALESQNATLQARLAELEALHPWGGKCIFVTSGIFTGNLGGLAGADAECREAARVAGLPGRYKAWISDSTASASERLVHSTVPYRRPDGVLVAQDWTDLTDGTLANPIDRTETGTQISPAPSGIGFTWTGTGVDGTATGNHCVDWTSSLSSQGTNGRVNRTNGDWTANAAERCDATHHLICLQQ